MDTTPRGHSRSRETNLIRAALTSIPTYVPGKPAATEAFKVSSNESPFPPVRGIRDALVSHLDGLNRYPDMAALELRARLAREHGVAAEQIHVSTGASAVLGDLVRATVDQGDEVVYAWRSFEAYPILVQSHGGVGVPVPLTGEYGLDLDAMASAVTDRTRLVLVCSPNNPTGTVIGTDALRNFLRSIPPTVTVALDEAYVEFADDGRAADSRTLFGEFGNLVRVRTFSKVYAMAGLRLGYAIAHPQLAIALDKVGIPFGSGSLAQVAALAAFEADARREIQDRVDWLRGERGRVLAAARVAGYEVPDSHGNFLYFPLERRTPDFVSFAEARGLIVRGYGDDGVRITIGEEAANDRTIEVLRAFGAR